MAHVLRPAEATAWRDGFSFLETARNEASKIREMARQGYATEYARGYEDGKAAGEAEAGRLVNETAAKVDRYLAGIEGEVVTLALEIVQRVLGDFDVGERVAQAAKHAIADLRRAKYIRLTVHPDVATEVKERLSGIVDEDALGCAIEVQADNALAPHACVIATDAAVFDASVEAQLEVLKDAIGKDTEAER
ncbi:type III secretion system stator protein SctL [Chelativorans salis]|uniref:Type 3 secretion system stator protein n=1 Tax=Chelativorans salis TaxID=2978478 RepID=A0ABT2LQL2_9HYPH|nr:type III secretion system stator protein SctL [Chelativorans sp. EGI FJ00035]MCT7376835.1 type III secretion system stator protein SctL [Chelativorans sp. EGI FJ00035]